MSTNQHGHIISVEASGDLSSSYYRFVTLNASGKLAVPSAGGSALGILLTKPTADGQVGGVCVRGVEKCEAGGSVTAGDFCKVDSSGRVVTASSADRAAGSARFWALEDGSSGDRIPGLLLDHAALTEATGVETVTSGALSAYTSDSFLSVTGTQAFTLPDGKYAGQEKVVECTVAATSPLGTLTVTTPNGSEPSSYLFFAVGQQIRFLWTGTAWKVISLRRAGVQSITMGTTTPSRLAARLALSVDGTKTTTLANGVVAGEVLALTCAAATNTPAGTVSATYTTLAGAAGTGAAVNATTDYLQLRWDGAAWQETASSSFAIS